MAYFDLSIVNLAKFEAKANILKIYLCHYLNQGRTLNDINEGRTLNGLLWS